MKIKANEIDFLDAILTIKNSLLLILSCKNKISLLQRKQIILTKKTEFEKNLSYKHSNIALAVEIHLIST